MRMKMLKLIAMVLVMIMWTLIMTTMIMIIMLMIKRMSNIQVFLLCPLQVLFELARFHAPSTIFLDELESLMSQRGTGGGG